MLKLSWSRGLAGTMVLACVILGMGFGTYAAEAPGGSDTGMEVDAPEETQYVEISDAQGLLDMELWPEGNYRLTADLDMTGTAWKPFAFHGILDGNGHAILNLTIEETGEAVRETFDGNMKVYDTIFAGLFDEMSGGSIRDLNLLNLRISVNTDQPCFIGGFAGYMEDALIENCSVQGILELRAHDRMFGVGGIIGYGKGQIRGSSADVTLVCIDTDASTKDEQFMGGVCAAGYPDINGCTIAIKGYDSDHGYVHDGGLVGMYMFYPKGTKYKGSITDNKVSGKITFFEDNRNRRAYCNGFVGEIMNWDFENGRNKDDFVRDEVFKYDKDLLPHSCENPVMTEEVTPPGCEFGFTTHTCETCGYTERDHYTLREHDYEWAVLKEATVTEEGLRVGTCRNCGAKATESIEKVIPEPTETPRPKDVDTDEAQGDLADTQTKAQEETNRDKDKIWTVPKVGRIGTAGIALGITACSFGIVWILTRKKQETDNEGVERKGRKR